MLFMKTSPAFSSHSLSKQKQHNDINLLKENFKSSLKQDQLLQKYSPQSQLIKKCLPAKFSHHPIYGELMIKFQSIVFLSNIPVSKSKNVIYRCRMLGYSHQELPFFSNCITYTIHTNNKMFKHYLKDMRICLVEILDARNYQPIGHFYINWLTHMKSIEDNQPLIEKDQNVSKYEQNAKPQRKYYLPFLDEQCLMTLPLFDYRNQKIVPKSPMKRDQNQHLSHMAKTNPKQRIIGQIQVKFMSRVYDQPIGRGYGLTQSQQMQKSHTENNCYEQPQQDNYNKINVVPSYLEIPQSNNLVSNKNMISLKSLSPSNKMSSKQERYDSFQVQNNLKQAQFIQLKRQQSNHSVFNQQKSMNKSGYQNIYKADGFGTGSKIYSHENQVKSNHRTSYEKETHKGTQLRANQLELLQLKLDAQDFFKVDQEQKLAKKQQKVVIEIIKLKSKLQNITQLDVFLNQNEDELYSQNKQTIASKPHIKIYKVSSDKLKSEDFFKSKVIIERPAQRIVEIHLPNNQGKCIFRCKDLTATSNDICIYNKGVIVGVLNIKKQTEKKSVISNVNPHNLMNSENKKALQSLSNQQLSKSQQDKICIVVVENFSEHFHKKSELKQLSNLDNYSISIKGVQFFHEALYNSKLTGQYAIINSQSIPKIFSVQVKNSSNQFVGMSQNITFEGNQINIMDQNIMPILILEKHISIQLKQMPVFKKLPNSITFRLSLYIANTNQLNYFINKWKQNVSKNKNLQVKKQRSLSNTRPLAQKQTQKIRQKQYTVSDQMASQTKNYKRIKTESQNKNSINFNHLQSKSSDVRQSDKSRFKTQGNYTEDLNNQALLGNRRSQIKEQEEQYSQKQGQQQDEIYLVEFFCKSLHYVLSKLGSKKIIQQKITQLNNYEYTKKNIKSQQSRTISQQNSLVQGSKGTVSKDQFERILSILIGDNKESHVEVLGFDVNQILEALFISQDGELIKMQEFTLCLMAYYNFMLLLTNEKLNALKQVLSCEPEAESKLSRIQESMTNINSQFLWQDVIPNVIQKTKQKVNKRYRIYPNTPFSVNLLLKDLSLARKNVSDSNDQSLFLSLLNILTVEEQKKYELFIRTTADLGNLVRQTVEEIIFTQFFKNSSVVFQNSWIQNALRKIEEFIQKQNLESISSEGKNEFCFNLTQFQQFFSTIGIQTSIWESLMLIQEIKVWHQGDQIKEKDYFQTGEGIVAVQLVKSWFNALNTKIEIKNKQMNFRKQINTKSSRLNSVKSLESDDEDIIEQINKREVRNNKVNEGPDRMVDKIKYVPKSPINKVLAQEYNESVFNQNGGHKKTQNNSFKQSQTMNNESDIANIANLLKQNEHNLYFLPSITDPNTLNKITSANNILSNQNILRGLEENTIRNALQSLSTKKTNALSINRQKIDQIESDSSQLRESEQSRMQIKKQKIESVYAYLSVRIKQIKLKKKQIVLQKQGLKKLCLSFKKNIHQNEDFQEEINEPNSKHKEHYFLTQQVVHKILNASQSQALLQNYALTNLQVDFNNLYEFQNNFNQGMYLELLNLTKQKDNKKKDISRDNKVEQLIFSGILPIEDIIKMSQDYKTKTQVQQKQSHPQEAKYSKKKTIVLYSGREIVGKAVVQITLSGKQIDQLREKTINEDVNLTKIEFSFVKKQLFSSKSKPIKLAQNIQPFLMSLSYCSIRDQQKVIELLPLIDENNTHEIHLPEPIIEYQLILRTKPITQPKVEQSILQGSNLNAMSISRFTRFENQKTPDQQNNQCKQQCIIPLETLYFKRSINEEYPLIDQQTGRFISSINVRLQVTQEKQQQRIIQKQKTQQSQEGQI